MRPGFLPEDEHKASVPVDRLLMPAEGPPAYTSLLGTEPWKVPTGLFSTGLPTTPRLATPESREFRITPDTLRFFASKADEIIAHTHGVESAFCHASARIELQQEELHRQVTKVDDIRARLGALRGPRQDHIEARVRVIQAGQQTLLGRLDRVLVELAKRANPTLSDHETKWFGELGRMREQVLGAGKYDEASLRARMQSVRTKDNNLFFLRVCFVYTHYLAPLQLKREYDRLLPHLKVLSEREQAQAKSMQEKNLGLGVSQAFEFGQQFNKEYVFLPSLPMRLGPEPWISRRAKLEKLQTDVLELASRLDLPLSRPPTLQGS
jgi:nucleoporin NUP82